MILHHGSSHIRKSADQSLFAAPRGLSQLVTSFIGSWCQGIHSMLLFAWTSADILLDIAVLSFAWIAVYHVFYSYLFSLSKIVSFYPTLERPDLSSYLFPLLIKSVRVLNSFPIQFSMINRRSEPALSSIFIGLLSYSSFLKSLKRPVKIKVGGLKWTRTTDLALIRRAL